jgi:hypothetical protein
VPLAAPICLAERIGAEMAKIIDLTPEQPDPDGEDWVLVMRDKNGIHSSGIAIHGNGATFYVPPTDTEPGIAIARADDWADRHGIPIVYLRLE